MKKLITMVLALSLVLSNNINIASAAGTVTEKEEAAVNSQPGINLRKGDRVMKGDTMYRITNTETRTVEYMETQSVSAKITIPGSIEISGEAYKVTKISSYAFKDNTTVKNVVIGSNVTTIEKRAFYGCASLKVVVLPPRLVNVGPNCFTGCTSLKKVTVKSASLTIKSIKNMFLSLKAVTVKLVGAAKVKYKSYVSIYKKKVYSKSIHIQK